MLNCNMSHLWRKTIIFKMSRAFEQRVKKTRAQRYVPTQTLSPVLSPAGTEVQWQFTAGHGSGLYGPIELFLYLPMIRFPVQAHQVLPRASHSQQDSSGYPDTVLRTGDEIKLQRLNRGTERLRLYVLFRCASLLVRHIQLPGSTVMTRMSLDCERRGAKKQWWEE